MLRLRRAKALVGIVELGAVGEDGDLGATTRLRSVRRLRISTRPEAVVILQLRMQYEG